MQPFEVTEFEVRGKTDLISTTFEVPSYLELIRHVGSGAYGCVASFRDRRTGGRVAVKKITNAFHDLVDGKRILREVKLLKQLDHENIIRIRDIFPPRSPDFEDIYIVTDLMDTDLSRVIKSKQVLSENHCQYFVFEILRGLGYLHSASIIHRDMKPANILVNKNCDVKICDFGLARVQASPVKDSFGQTDYVVTRWYRAPEVALHPGEYTSSIDVWAVGCILAEIVLRKPLFPGKDFCDQLRVIIRTLGTPEEAERRWVVVPSSLKFLSKCPSAPKVCWSNLFPNVNPSCTQALEAMLRFDPGDRVSVPEAMLLSYFEDIMKVDAERGECIFEGSPVDWSFDDFEPSKALLQDRIYQECVGFHPEITARDRGLLEERRSTAHMFPEKLLVVPVVCA